MNENKYVIPNTSYSIYLQNELGAGNFGRVYLVYNSDSGKLHAIKTEIKTNKQMLNHEINIIQKLSTNYNNMINIYNYGYLEDFNLNYYITDLLGKSIGALVRQLKKGLPCEVFKEYAPLMLKQLEQIHKLDIVHRDIKPDNFLLDYKLPIKNIYLIDYGLSYNYKEVNSGKSRRIGTVRYMSINAHEKGIQTPLDDIYSLGYVFLFMIIGKLHWFDIKYKTKEERNKKIYNMKKGFTNRELTHFANRKYNNDFMFNYFNYCDEIKEGDTINYDYLINLVSCDII